jgi:hypothetical protein
MAYVGWEMEVDVVLGTRPLHQMPRRTEGANMKWRTVKTGFTRGGTIGFGMGLSPKFGGLSFNTSANIAGSLNETFTREHFRPSRTTSKNYELRFRDLYKQMVILYDAKNGRAWLVPKVNIVLLLVRIFMATVTIKKSISVPYPETRLDEGKAWKAIKDLEQKRVEEEDWEGATSQTFGDLFIEFAQRLGLALNHVEFGSHSSSSAELCGVELMDIYDGIVDKLKKLKCTDGIMQWCGLIEGVGIVLCEEIEPALLPRRMIAQATSAIFLWCSDSLCCTVGDLKMLMIEQGWSWRTYREKGYIERRDMCRWVLKNDPFKHTCHGIDAGECGSMCLSKRMQKIETSYVNETRMVQAQFSLDSLCAGLCFGRLRSV